MTQLEERALTGTGRRYRRCLDFTLDRFISD
jgi:hypothetical protein